MILLIDNYDSFSYNLYQALGKISEINSNSDITVVRNDKITISEIKALSPSHIVLSPGPGKPSEAGICVEVVKKLGGAIPIFGVCLGHQAICEAFGATVSHAKRLMHGKSSEVKINSDCAIFNGLPETIKAARYHSLSAVKDTLPDALNAVAYALDDNEIMAVKHKDFEIYGVQFHPESILTPLGETIIANFLRVKG